VDRLADDVLDFAAEHIRSGADSIRLCCFFLDELPDDGRGESGLSSERSLLADVVRERLESKDRSSGGIFMDETELVVIGELSGTNEIDCSVNSEHSAS